MEDNENALSHTTPSTPPPPPSKYYYNYYDINFGNHEFLLLRVVFILIEDFHQC